jgi:hypothetical protein
MRDSVMKWLLTVGSYGSWKFSSDSFVSYLVKFNKYMNFC